MRDVHGERAAQRAHVKLISFSSVNSEASVTSKREGSQPGSVDDALGRRRRPALREAMRSAARVFLWPQRPLRV